MGTPGYILPHCVTFVTCADAFLGNVIPHHGSGFVFVFCHRANWYTLVIFQIVQFTLIHTGRDFATLDITAGRQFTHNTIFVLAFTTLLGQLVCF